LRASGDVIALLKYVYEAIIPWSIYCPCGVIVSDLFVYSPTPRERPSSQMTASSLTHEYRRMKRITLTLLTYDIHQVKAVLVWL
jgi:hypothetical protein